MRSRGESRPRLATALALLAIVGAASPAPAARAADDAPTDAAKASARAHMSAGYIALGSGDAAGALARFRAAEALVRVPTTLLAVARALAARGQLVEAETKAEEAASLPPAPREHRVLAEARRDAAALADALRARVPTLLLRGDAATIDVVLDGAAVPEAARAAPLRVNPGDHVLELRRGGQVERRVLRLDEREARVIDLGAAGAAAAVRRVPATGATDDGGSNGLRSALALGSFAGSAAAVGLGSVTGALALAAVARAERDGCAEGTCPPAAFAEIEDARRLGDVSTVAFVTADALVALGVTALLALPARRTSGAIAPALAGGDGPLGPAVRGQLF